MADFPQGGKGGPETDPVAEPRLDAHEAATTDVHGIADTAALSTKAEVEAAEAAAAKAGEDAAAAVGEDLSDHEADTTNVHGIANTAALATKTETQAVATDLQAHEDATTDVHGILDTSELVVASALAAFQQLAQRGQANGYAPLDAGAKVPVNHLPNSIMEYQGTWNAATNSPALEDGEGSPGDVFRVSVAGERNLGSGVISFAVGDYVVYNGSAWEKSDTTDSVPTVFGRTGNVTAQSGDYSIGQISGAGTAASKDAGAAGEAGKVLNADDPTTSDARTPKAHTHPQEDVTGLVAALAGKQPLDADLTAIAALSTTSFGRSLLALADAAAGRSALEAAAASHTHAQADVTGLVADLEGKQPLDADLTAIAALSTTSLGRSLLAIANPAAGRSILEAAAASHGHTQAEITGLVAALEGKAPTEHTHAQSDVIDLVSDLETLALAIEGRQPLDSDLTAIAALSTTSLGRSLLAIANPAAGRSILEAAAASHTHAQSEVTGLVAALEGKQPLDSDLTAIAALTTTTFGRSLLAVADAAAGRSTLGAAAASHTHAQSDVTGLVAALEGKQPLDSDLTAIAALTTTSVGRSLLAIADAAAGRTILEAAAATHTHAQSDVTGLVAALEGKQPLDSDLTAIAALTTTSFGRAFLALTDAAAARSAISAPSSAELATEVAAREAADNATDYKASVRVCTTTNVTISTALNAGDVIDGVTLSAGDRVLVANQLTPSQNDIYIAGSSPARAPDSEGAETSAGTMVYVEEGTIYGGRVMTLLSAFPLEPTEWEPLAPADFGLVSALPTTKALKGDKCQYQNASMATAGIAWELVYTGSGELPWSKIGGRPLWSEVVTNESRENTAYGDLTTVGPSVDLPLKGDYDIDLGAKAAAVGGSAHSIFMSYAIGAAAAADADALVLAGNVYAFNTTDMPSTMRSRRKTGLTAVKLTAKYRTAAPGGGFWEHRWMRADPVRVG